MKIFTRIGLIGLFCLFLLVGIAGKPARAFTPPLEVSLVDAELTYVGEENGDWAGYFASPAGDVNGDGLGDLLIGAPLGGDKMCPYPPLPDGSCPDPYLPKGQGVSYLVLGKPKSEFPSGPINLFDAEASFLGCDINSMTGRQLYTAGDVNGDNYDDIVISGWKCGDNFTGKAYLFLGRQDVSTWGRWYPVEQADASFLGENEEDFLSYYVSTAGDINADGLDDIVITSTHYDVISGTQTVTNTGKAYLILGRQAADWGADFDLSQADASFLGEAEQDRLGRSAAGVGDVNGDGFGDLLIGSISSDQGGWDAGQNYLFLGRRSPDDPLYDPNTQPWWGTNFPASGADASFLGESVGEEAGRRVAHAGDVNGDGLDDFLIGAARNGTAGYWAGISYLMLGRAAADWGLHFDLANADASFIGEEEQDQAGRRLSGAGDVNDDGLDDFLIGAPHNERGGELAGAAYLIYGRAAVDWGTHFSLSNADIIHIGKPGVGVAGYDIGWLGDFDGDNIDDYLIAAYGGRNEKVEPGETYVLLGSQFPELKAKTPMPISFKPGSREGWALEWYGYNTVYWDPNGRQDLASLELILGEDVNDLNGLNVKYNPGTNEIHLLKSDGSGYLPPCQAGDPGPKPINDSVQLDCTTTIVTLGVDDLRLSIRWAVRFLNAPDLSNTYNAYMRAVDQSGNDSLFHFTGNWVLLNRGIFLPLVIR